MITADLDFGWLSVCILAKYENLLPGNELKFLCKITKTTQANISK